VGQEKDSALKSIGGIIEYSRSRGYSNMIIYKKLVTRQPLCPLKIADKNGSCEELK
jgi:hypothetical protein